MLRYVDGLDPLMLVRKHDRAVKKVSPLNGMYASRKKVGIALSPHLRYIATDLSVHPLPQFLHLPSRPDLDTADNQDTRAARGIDARDRDAST